MDIIQIDNPELKWETTPIGRKKWRVKVSHSPTGYTGVSEGESFLLTKQKAWLRMVLDQQEQEFGSVYHDE